MSYLTQAIWNAERKGVAPAWPTKMLSSDGKVLFEEHSANQTLSELWNVFIESYGGYDFWIFKALTQKEYLEEFLDRSDVKRASLAVVARAIGDGPANPLPDYRVIFEAATRTAQNYLGRPTLPDYLEDPGARIVFYLLIRHSRQLNLSGGSLRYDAVDDSDVEEEERDAERRDRLEMDIDSDDGDLPEVNLRPQGGGANPGHDFTASLPSGVSTSP